MLFIFLITRWAWLVQVVVERALLVLLALAHFKHAPFDGDDDDGDDLFVATVCGG